MMRQAEIWRHRGTTDVDMYFVSVPYKGPTYIKAKVIYINRHNSIIYNAASPQLVKIQRKDFWLWSKVS